VPLLGIVQRKVGIALLAAAITLTDNCLVLAHRLRRCTVSLMTRGLCSGPFT